MSRVMTFVYSFDSPFVLQTPTSQHGAPVILAAAVAPDATDQTWQIQTVRMSCATQVGCRKPLQCVVFMYLVKPAKELDDWTSYQRLPRPGASKGESDGKRDNTIRSISMASRVIIAIYLFSC